MSTDTNQHRGRKRIELPPRPPAKQYESGVTFDVVHPDGTERRITIQQPTQERYMIDDVIEVDTPNWTAFTDELPRGVWPGSGERRDTCGKEIPGLFCPDCGHVQRVGACCDQSRCSRCWRSWVLRRTRAMAANLSAYARVRAQQNPNMKRHHITASLGEMKARFNSTDPLNQGATIARRIMPLMNVEAGYITYHPYRIATEHRGDVYGHESGDGDMTPRDVLDLVASESWSWEAIEDEYLTFAPHFHIVCVSPFAQCGAITKKIYERTGIVIHRITDGDSSVSIRGENDTAGVLAYNLSHCGLIEDENGRFRPPTRSFGPVETFDTAPVEDAVTAAVRSVSRRVVGLSLPTGKCGARVPKGATSTTASTATESTPTATAASDDDSDLPAFVVEQLPDADGGGDGDGRSTPAPAVSPTLTRAPTPTSGSTSISGSIAGR